MFQDDLWDLWATPDSYRTVFANHGFNQITVSAKEITSRIKSSPIKPHLVAAIDDWATVADEREQSVLRALAREVDNEPWKNQLRNAIAEGDVTKLKRLINSDERFVKSRVTVATVTNLLVKNGETEYAIELLRRAHRKYPTDFWINYVLGIQLQNRAPLEAIGFLIVAKSQRPKSGTTCNALGNAYYLSQQYENAEAEFRKAVQLDPSRVWHHSNLAQTLARLHRLSEGEKVCRETLEAFPDDPLAHYRLCEVKLALGQSSDARKACQDAVRFVSESTGPYVRRGLALILAASELEGLRNGKKAVELAIRACEQTDYRQSETLIVLAAAYAELGNFELAIKWAEEAVSVTESDLYREAISQQLEKFRSHEPLRLSFRLTRFHAGHR
jgi:tetratricopeptide (TPR) repeat protein